MQSSKKKDWVCQERVGNDKHANFFKFTRVNIRIKVKKRLVRIRMKSKRSIKNEVEREIQQILVSWHARDLERIPLYIYMLSF